MSKPECPVLPKTQARRRAVRQAERQANRLAVRLAGLALCSVLVACGGGGGAPESPQSATPPAPAPTPAPTPAPPPAPTPAPAPAQAMSVRSLDTGSSAPGVAHNTQQGVALADVPITLHTEAGTLFATRWLPDGGAPQGQALASTVENATLATRGDRLLAVYLQTAPLRQLVARESADGGQTWEPPQVIATAPAGPARPSACLFEQAGVLKRLVVWSAPAAPGAGPLLAARHDGAGWLAAVAAGADHTAGAALACADEQMPEAVWTDQRDAGGAPALWQAGIDMDTGVLRGSRHLVQPGLDAAHCRAGDRRFVSWHDLLNTARLAHSDDVWQSTTEIDANTGAPGNPLDDHGRYVALACAGDTVAVAWSDWPSRAEADALAPNRQLAVRISRDRGATWARVEPAGADLDQGPATLAVHADGRVALVWRAPGAMRLATWGAP